MRTWMPSSIAIFVMFAVFLLAGCGEDAATSSQLVNVRDLPTGHSLCEFGGVLIEVGTDSNDDGILDSLEVNGSDAICNGGDGVQGTDGATSLIAFNNFESNPICPGGGQQVKSGPDLNGNGVLDSDEVAVTEVICDGDSGKSPLVSFFNEFPGNNCSNGGQRLDIGIDEDEDGTLSPEEVLISEYICNGGELAVRVGNVERGDILCPAGGIRLESGIDHNDDGILDDSEVDDIQAVCNRYVTQISAGASHTCALRSDGELRCWGDNQTFQLGFSDEVIGASSLHSDPLVLGHLPVVIAQIATGSSHTCALDIEEGIWCWGSNTYGQLGQDPASLPSQIVSDPVAVFEGLSQEDGSIISELFSGAISLTLGDNFGCALRAEGDVYCWGHNDHGQLGDGRSGEIINDEESFLASPVLVVGGSSSIALDSIVQLTAGEDHACGLSNTADVWCWGGNTSNQLGDAVGTTINSLASSITGLSDIAAIAAGDQHTCALKNSDGSVWCWGNNTYGQLGTDPLVTGVSSTPIQVTTDGISPLLGVREISAGLDMSCAIADEGIWCWGRNDHGQLGVDAAGITETHTPQRVAQLRGALHLDVGGGHVCATRHGVTHCWGNGQRGQLGDGNTADTHFPVQVPDDLAP